MEYYYNYESFDISPIIKKFKGYNLEEFFPNNDIISNGMGKFLQIHWECEEIPHNFKFSKSRKNILKNLKTVYYIGEDTEKRLINRGVRNLFDLSAHLRFRDSANEILSLIRNKDYYELCQNRYIYDLDTSFCFSLEDFLFIDIETLGLYDSPIIIVGIGVYRQEKYHIYQFFTRTIEEEIAICDHLKNEVFPQYRCLVSYNGKSFDIPYIANRFIYYFDENPMINEDEDPYKSYNTRFGHIDLYHNCRRKYKGQYTDYKLTTMEKELLNWKRDNELPSSMVGYCYKKYLEDPKRYVGLIKEAIEHNFYDVKSLPLIFRKLLD